MVDLLESRVLLAGVIDSGDHDDVTVWGNSQAFASGDDITYDVNETLLHTVDFKGTTKNISDIRIDGNPVTAAGAARGIALNNGTLNVVGPITVEAGLTVTNVTLTSGDISVFGATAPSQSVLALSSSPLAATSLRIGQTGDAAVSATGGNVVVSGNAIVGDSEDGTLSVNFLNGTDGLASFGSLTIGANAIAAGMPNAVSTYRQTGILASDFNVAGDFVIGGEHMGLAVLSSVVDAVVGGTTTIGDSAYGELRLSGTGLLSTVQLGTAGGNGLLDLHDAITITAPLLVGVYLFTGPLLG